MQQQCNMKKLFLLLFLFYHSVHACFAQQDTKIKTVTVNSESTDESNLAPSLEILEGKYSFEQISSGKYDSLFSKNTISDTGSWDKSCWARIKITSDADKITSWVLKTDKQYGEVTCYIVYPDGKKIIQKSGWNLPPAKRSVNDADVIFNLSLAENQVVDVYLKIHTNLRWSTLDHVQATLFSMDEWSNIKWKKFAFLLFYAGICVLAVFFWLMTVPSTFTT